MRKTRYVLICTIAILCVFQYMMCYHLYRSEKVGWKERIEDLITKSMIDQYQYLKDDTGSLVAGRILSYDPKRKKVYVTEQGVDYDIPVDDECETFDITRKLCYDSFVKNSFSLSRVDSLVRIAISGKATGFNCVYVRKEEGKDETEHYPAVDFNERGYSLQQIFELSILSSDTLSVYYNYPFGYFLQNNKSEIFMAIGLFVLLLLGCMLLFESYQRQRKQNKFQERMISQMMHDFKRPIDAVKSTVEYWGREFSLNEKDKKRYELTEDSLLAVKDNMKYIIAMVTKMCSIRVIRKEFDLRLELERMLNEWNLNDGEYKISLDYQLSETKVYLSDVYFMCAVSNLVDNAIKYTKGTPRVKVSCYPEGKGIALAVEDNGIGMSKEFLDNIFVPYYRAEDLKVPGFGLGLPFVKEVVEKHGGRIRVESVVGEGSKFIIYLKRWKK